MALCAGMISWGFPPKQRIASLLSQAFSFAARRRCDIRVFGNTQGLKASQVRGLERLGRRQIPQGQLISQDFARALTAVSHAVRRQVGVLVDRRGSVTHVMVGNHQAIELPDWGRLRAGKGRFRGLRCVHTHLRGESLNRDDLTDLALLRLDAMIAVSVNNDGIPGRTYVAALCADEKTPIEQFEAAYPAQLDFDFRNWISEREDSFARFSRAREVGTTERALLVSVATAHDRVNAKTATAELRELATSAGVQVIDVLQQQRKQVDPKTVVGAGKLQELVIRAFQENIDLVIVDHDLSPTQARNLAERMELRVIDRSQLILDIFAQRATSRDGKLQVELAQLQHRLPRLAQRDSSLSRLAGGIGGRGPGETKLEVDRRRVRGRIHQLEKELQRLRKGREARRKRRLRHELPILSIVGYTNAGKSTLLQTLTQRDAGVGAQMFATLDPASRRLRFPRERDVIVTDTVGFIRDLPPALVAAFRATLEELNQASLFLHVVDAAAPELERRLEAVWKVIREIGLEETPEILVLNKADQIEVSEQRALAERFGGVAISALRGMGIHDLLQRAENLVWNQANSENRSYQN